MNTTLHNMRWLMKREYIEHRKLIYAGPWLGVALLVLNLVFTVIVFFHSEDGIRFSNDSNHGSTLAFHLGSDTHLGVGLGHLSADNISELSHAIFVAVNGALGLFVLALGASVLSFGLSCLFDERRDRSVLFWKSMPTTDTQTVAAKFIFGLLVLPLVWVAVALVTSGLLVATYALAISWAGGDLGLVFAHSQLLTLAGLVMASVPVYLLTLVPALAWVMLCSATARRHPAVIALIVPALFALLGAMGWHNPVWNLLIGRLFPTGFVSGLRADAVSGASWTHVVAPVLSPLADPQLWLGIVFGAACLAAVIWYRRRYTVLV